MQAGNMASCGVGGLLETHWPMARPQPKSPPLITFVPLGAVLWRATPREAAVLSPRTTTTGGRTAGVNERARYRWTWTAAVAGWAVVARMTTVVVTNATVAGAMARSERQNVPTMIGRSTK